MGKTRRRFISAEYGFTLIELIVIIAILGIIAVIAIPRLGGMTDKAKLSEAHTAIGSIRSSLEMIYTDKNSYISADTGDAYKSAANLLVDTDLDEYLDNISDNWQYNIAAATNDYLIEVIGNGGKYPNSLKASITKGDADVITTTKNDIMTASTSP